jgi:hypothetical protein
MSIFDILGTPHINDWPGVKYLPHFKVLILNMIRNLSQN